MSDYSRPEIEPIEFRDSSGGVIKYGDRWAGIGSPPEESYSVAEHPERFAPLHNIAAELITHVSRNYDVSLEEGKSALSGLLHHLELDYVTRVVRFNPASPLSAPMTIVFTQDFGVSLYAGALFHASFPSCGCDACDETWETCADELESIVFAIVGGGLTERLGPSLRPKWRFKRHLGLVKSQGQTVRTDLQVPNGSFGLGSQTSVSDIPEGLRKPLFDALAEIRASDPNGTWHPWTKMA